MASPDWPGWRGVNTSGISPDKNLPVEWSTRRGIRWKQTVPGEGNSSPVVCGDKVIVTSAVNEADNKRLIVCCFERRSGEPQWQVDIG
ncbi:MAG TPA: PQQ-binding-like beta-propeller repeat protein, partial [Pirellulales bacterium]